MVTFHSYVSLPEGKVNPVWSARWSGRLKWEPFDKEDSQSLLLFLGSLRLFVRIGCGISVWTSTFCSFWNQCCIGGFRYDGSIVKSYHSLFPNMGLIGKWAPHSNRFSGWFSFSFIFPIKVYQNDGELTWFRNTPILIQFIPQCSTPASGLHRISCMIC